MTRFVALSGLPRSGSTLCCRLVDAAPNAIALVEPMNVAELPGEDAGCSADAVLQFFHDSDASLRSTGVAPTVHANGVVPDNPYGVDVGDGGLRHRTVQASSPVQFSKRLDDQGLLLVKHNAAFAALMPELKKRLRVIALIRNPVAVLCSWQTVPIPPQKGRAPGGEHFDAALSRALASESDRLERQLTLMDWFFGRFQQFAVEGDLVRYETMVATGGQHLYDVLGLHGDPIPLQERNASAIYNAVDVRMLLDRLLAFRGRWEHFYSRSDLLDVADRIARLR